MKIYVRASRDLGSADIMHTIRASPCSRGRQAMFVKKQEGSLKHLKLAVLEVLQRSLPLNRK
jgi:hypothetical protein